jgi:hypothetical protein
VHLNNFTLSSERLTRWRLKLAEYDFKVTYRKGLLNGNADSFSRLEKPASEEQINNSSVDLLENILTITKQVGRITDKIKYKNEDILQSPENEAIAITTSAEMSCDTGIPFDVSQKFEGHTKVGGQKRAVGSCIQWKNSREIFSLITRETNTATSSMDNLNLCLTNLKARCNQLAIKHIAFAKYKNGLDKLEWNTVKTSINQILIGAGIQCSVYLNTKACPYTEFSITILMNGLQAEDPYVQKVLKKLNENKQAEGFIVEDGVLLKIRRTRNNKIFKK